MQLREEFTSDFSAGQFDSVAATAFPKNACAQITNGRIQRDGTVRRRQGSQRLHSAALVTDGVGYGATYFQLADGTEQLLAIFNGSAFYSEDWGATWTSITTGLRQDYYSFATMRVGATNYLFAANGDSTIKRWDGATWDTLSGAPSGVKYIAVFNGRLWVTGHNGVIAQGSKIADPTTFTIPDGTLVQVAASSGDPPTGMFQIGPHLLIFSRHSTSYIDGYGDQDLVVAAGATGFSRSVGCVAFRTVAGVGDNGACWLSERGVEYYTPGGGIALLSKPVQRFIQSLNWAQLYAFAGRMSAVYDPIEQNYHLALSTNGTRNNRTLVLNIQQQVTYQRSGIVAAAAVDQPQASGAASLLFGDDGAGYLGIIAGGVELIEGTDGYVALATGPGGGDTIGDGGDGYLAAVTDDTLPATLFLAPTADAPSKVYSQGSDGFVRLHDGVNLDDVLSDGTGGTAVTMTVVTRPFMYGNPEARKRARVIYVSAIAEDDATISVGPVGPSGDGTLRSLAVPATTNAQARRKYPSRTSLISDTPQAKVQTSDDVRLALVRMDAELLREPL